MSNIIEKRIKLNMKTETREERTLNTPMVVDGMRHSLPPPLDCTAQVLLFSKGYGKGSSLWWNECVAAKVGFLNVWWCRTNLWDDIGGGN